MEVTKSVDIAVPPETLWSFMSEPTKILEWYIPLEKFEYTGEKRNEVDAPFYYEEKTGAGTIKLNCVVTEWNENAHIAFKMTSGNMMKSYQESWTVEATSSGSSFTFMEKGELGLGIIGKIIGPLAERSSASTIDKMLAKLKSLAEGKSV
jgi:uncharacterized protein YndB with AHSA1/START domain